MVKYEFLSAFIDILIAIVFIVISIPIWHEFNETINTHPVLDNLLLELENINI